MTESKGALAGLVVIDLTRVLGGPYCTQILGDHGAEIIKIEPPQGDEVRDWGPPFREGDASYFIGVNRNKRSLGLDLSKAEGREVLLRLLERADVLIENYKPGAMEKWGLGYEEVLKPRFPGLIHCRISGFGADGPLGGYPGYDAVIQAMTGMFSINGTTDSGPTRLGIPMVDIGTGLYAAIGLLMALQERHHSGEGQYIDLTLYDSGIALMHPHIPNYALSGKVPVQTGNGHPNIAPYDKFKTKTVDVFIAAGNDRAFQRICEALDRPDLAADERYQDNAGRVTNREALNDALRVTLGEVDGEEICERLLARGVPIGPVLDLAQVMAHPQTQHREMDLQRDGYRSWGIPIKFSRTPGSLRHTPPHFGAEGRDILSEFGFSDQEIDGLAESGTLVEERRRK